MVLWSFIAGIGLSAYVPQATGLYLAVCLVGLGLCLLIKKQIRIVIIIVCAGCLGLVRAQLAQVDYTDTAHIYSHDQEYVVFEARVVDIETRLDSQKITLTALDEYTGRVLITTQLYPRYYVGQRMKVGCKLQRPESFEGFNYQAYLARYSIYILCYRPKIEVTGLDRNLAYYLYQLKLRLSSAINMSLPEPQAAIIQAMVLANRRGIPQTLLDKFANVGISHVIAISGMHIAIISGVLMSLIISLGIIRQKAFYLALTCLIGYVILIGLPASAVRATVMGGLVLYAQKIGRLNSSFNALSLAAVLMLFINPKLLLSDIGFQLSFAATWGIIFISPVIKKHTSLLPSWGQTKEILTMTISAQITTLPLIVYYFRKLSLISLVANIFILPVVPFVLLGGVATAILGWLDIVLGRLVGFLVWMLVSYMLMVVEVLNSVGGYWEV